MTLLVMSSSPISISHRFSWCKYSNSREVVLQGLLPFPPHRQSAPESLLAGYIFNCESYIKWLVNIISKN